MGKSISIGSWNNAEITKDKEWRTTNTLNGCSKGSISGMRGVNSKTSILISLVQNIYEEFQQSQKINKDGHIPPTLEVSRDHKRQILGELRLLNVTRETLYPGLDEAAKAVTQHHSN